jgi:signal transduction histidine kinase
MLRLLLVAGRRHRDDAVQACIHRRRDAADRATLAGRIPALEHRHDVALAYTAEKVPSIQGNAGELGSAIENVLRNALLHAGAEAEVAVALRRAGPSVIVTVADNGPGVPEEALSHLFEPFYRADPSRDHQQSGYGLGLAIASSIIERHGGSVEAKNRTGGGLEVTFRLPTRPRH